MGYSVEFFLYVYVYVQPFRRTYRSILRNVKDILCKNRANSELSPRDVRDITESIEKMIRDHVHLLEDATNIVRANTPQEGWSTFLTY